MRWLVLSIMVFFAATCGQKGPLTRPTTDPVVGQLGIEVGIEVGAEVSNQNSSTSRAIIACGRAQLSVRLNHV